MTVYRVTRADIGVGSNLYERAVLSVEELKEGTYTLMGDVVELPIGVDRDDTVRVFPNATIGAERVVVFAGPDDAKLEDYLDMKSMDILVQEGSTYFSFPLGGELWSRVERHALRPIEFSLKSVESE